MVSLFIEPSFIYSLPQVLVECDGDESDDPVSGWNLMLLCGQVNWFIAMLMLEFRIHGEIFLTVTFHIKFGITHKLRKTNGGATCESEDD